jgi:hypothetical protein
MCNRYLSAAIKLDMLDVRKRKEHADNIIQAKYDLLDEWVPRIAQRIHSACEGNRTLKPERLDF